MFSHSYALDFGVKCGTRSLFLVLRLFAAFQQIQKILDRNAYTILRNGAKQVANVGRMLCPVFCNVNSETKSSS